MKKTLNINKNNKSKKTTKQTERKLGFVSISTSLSDPFPASRLWVPDNEVHRFTSTQETINFITTSVTVPVFANVAWALNNFPDYTAYTTLFDQYRISEVEVWIIPKSAYSSSSTVDYGLMTSCIDYDDQSNLATIADGLAHTNSITTSGNQLHYHRFKPKIAIAAYGGSLFTSFANANPMWLDCGSPGIPHYGIKVAISATDSVYKFDLLYKMRVDFRNVRA
jgi:hypothetical protein